MGQDIAKPGYRTRALPPHRAPTVAVATAAALLTIAGTALPASAAPPARFNLLVVPVDFEEEPGVYDFEDT